MAVGRWATMADAGVGRSFGRVVVVRSARMARIHHGRIAMIAGPIIPSPRKATERAESLTSPRGNGHGCIHGYHLLPSFPPFLMDFSAFKGFFASAPFLAANSPFRLFI